MIQANTQELERLNAQLALATSDIEGNSLLANAQRAWEQYRQANCLAEASLEEGSITQPLLTSCLVNETRRRVEWFQEFHSADGP